MMVAWGTVAAGALAPFQAISSQGTPQDGRLQQKLHVCYLFPSISGPFLVTHSSGAARCTSLRDVRLTAMPAYVTQQMRSSQVPFPSPLVHSRLLPDTRPDAHKASWRP